MQVCYPEPSSGFTQVKPTTIQGKIVQFPLVRLILAVLFLVPASYLHKTLNYLIKTYVPTQYTDIGTVVDSLVGIIFLLASYWLYCHWIERRTPSEISLQGGVVEFLKGVGVAVFLIGLVVSIVLFLSEFTIEAGADSGLSLIAGKPPRDGGCPGIGSEEEVIDPDLPIRAGQPRQDPEILGEGWCE